MSVLVSEAERFTYYDWAVETTEREVLAQLQWEKFQRLLQPLWASNAFYRRKWKEAGLKGPEDLRGWEDFRRLPFTRKSELVRDQEETPPFGSNLTVPLAEFVRYFQTSGTTGKPLKWMDTLESWEWWARCWCFVYRAAGVGPGDRIFFPFSFGPFVGFWSAFEGARKLGALSIPGGGQDSGVRLNTIRETRPTVICCTPSYALRLAEIARAEGMDLAAAGIRVTIHAGEPGASIPATKKRIEEAWGAKCYDHYGLTEMGAVSFECQAQPGGAHINESEFIAEILDPSTSEPVPPGQDGELVLTNLGRAGMPNIRYRTGDRVRANYERCACGRTFLRLQGGILGRVDDMLVVRGVNVYPGAIENIVRGFPEVLEFQVDVLRRQAMDELCMHLEIDNAMADPQAVAERVAEEIRRQLLIRIQVKPALPGSLPRYEMKARRFVRREE